MTADHVLRALCTAVATLEDALRAPDGLEPRIALKTLEEIGDTLDGMDAAERREFAGALERVAANGHPDLREWTRGLPDRFGRRL
ncbi:hypothetical protein ACFY00_16805 [Kitasatospora sp. NPDC001540]|uniref:hypothetical protein n=1 Tax=Kitasatospora sp. NPDC001540 TaxID=3364014 RepID=UPI0036C777A4